MATRGDSASFGSGTAILYMRTVSATSPISRSYAVLEVVLVSVLGWGVVGAALAPAVGQYCGLVVMLTLLFRERALLPEHFTSPPSLASIMPLLKVSASACT